MHKNLIHFKITIIFYSLYIFSVFSCGGGGTQEHMAASMEKYRLDNKKDLATTAKLTKRYMEDRGRYSKRKLEYLKKKSVTPKDDTYGETFEEFMEEDNAGELKQYIKSELEPEINRSKSYLERKIKARDKSLSSNDPKRIQKYQNKVDESREELKSLEDNLKMILDNLPTNLNTLFLSATKAEIMHKKLIADDEKFLAQQINYVKKPVPVKYSSYEDLIKSPSAVKFGNGEYLVLSNDGKEVSKDTFSGVFDIILDNLKDDVEDIKKKVAMKYQNIDLVIIPNTMYCLMVMKYIIKEEQSKFGFCPMLQEGLSNNFKKFYNNLDIKNLNDKQKKHLNECWHINQIIEEEGYVDKEKNRFLFDTLAYRANQLIIKDYQVKNSNFLTGPKVKEIENTL